MRVDARLTACGAGARLTACGAGARLIACGAGARLTPPWSSPRSPEPEARTPTIRCAQCSCSRQAVVHAKLAVRSSSVLVSKLNPGFPRVWDLPTAPIAPSCASTEFLVLEPRSTSSSVLAALVSNQRFSDALQGKVSGTSGSHQRVKPVDLLATEVGDPGQLTPAIGNRFLLWACGSRPLGRSPALSPRSATRSCPPSCPAHSASRTPRSRSRGWCRCPARAVIPIGGRSRRPLGG